MDSKNQVIDNLKSECRWLRLLFMGLFTIAAYITGFIILMVVIVQIVHNFIAGKPHDRLLALTACLNQYFYQMLQYISYNSDTKPYPCSDWPKGNIVGNKVNDK